MNEKQIEKMPVMFGRIIFKVECQQCFQSGVGVIFYYFFPLPSGVRLQLFRIPKTKTPHTSAKLL